jgi:HEAT repeat protein
VTIDLSPWRDAPDLIDAIWEARRAGRRDLKPAIAELLEHEDSTVREEALSLLFVKWRDSTLSDKLLQMIESDPDFGVRARAAGALVQLDDNDSRQLAKSILSGIVLDREDDPIVRKAAYEALHEIVKGRAVVVADDIDLDQEVDMTWVHDC